MQEIVAHDNHSRKEARKAAGSRPQRLSGFSAFRFAAYCLLFFESLDEIDVFAAVKAVGSKVIDEVAVVPVEHRVDD